MLTTATRIAEYLKTQSFVKVVTHIDADGITAGAIASLALDRAGIEHEMEFIKQLDGPKVRELKEETRPLWFTDLGSAKLSEFDPSRTIVTDHHIPQDGMEKERNKFEGNWTPEVRRGGSTSSSSGQMNLFDFTSNHSFDISESPEKCDDEIDADTSVEPYHLNPHLFGLSGANEISGAGVTYLVARALDHNNTDLAALAVVGAVGDLQDSAECKLGGMNRTLLEDAVARGVVEVDTDVRYFGRETRPLYKILQYSSDPIVPMISGNEAGALEFLMDRDIEMKRGDGFRSWIHLTREEKRVIVSGLVKLCLSHGLELRDVRRMVGEVYQLTMNEVGTPLHDTKEFATMLNACGKNLNPEIGFQVCKGDRGEYLERAYGLLQGHRRNLAGFIQLVEQELGIEQRDVVQYFDAGTEIPENIVGIVAGMVLNSGSADLKKVMLGIAKADEGLKISARTTRSLVLRGINLAQALKTASGEVGGEGGGHNIAAGAFIPDGELETFLDLMEKELKHQLIQGVED